MSSAPELESLRDFGLLPQIEDFLNLIDRIAAENQQAMQHVGGNILIHIREVATRTIVTKGVNRGSHHEALDVDVDFALVCEEWVLLDLLDDEFHADLGSLVEGGFLYIQGDAKVWDRFLELGEEKSALSIRAGLASATPQKKKQLRKVMSR